MHDCWCWGRLHHGPDPGLLLPLVLLLPGQCYARDRGQRLSSARRRRCDHPRPPSERRSLRGSPARGRGASGRPAAGAWPRPGPGAGRQAEARRAPPHCRAAAARLRRRRWRAAQRRRLAARRGWTTRHRCASRMPAAAAAADELAREWWASTMGLEGEEGSCGEGGCTPEQRSR